MRVALLLAAASLSVAQDDPDHRIPPGYEPELGPDEDGIWLEIEEYEKAIRRSALLVENPDINNYVDSVVCRVAADYCRDFRVYVIRNPGFNASMTATGVMQIWTGLLLRARSTDEVAAVVGHEIAHYTRLHTLERMRDMRSRSSAGTVFDVALLALTGINVPVGQLTAMLNILSFSREQESEADFLGTKLVYLAAYDPHASYRVWESLIAEEEAAAVKRREPGLFTSTHPAAKDRAVALREWVTDTWGPPDPSKVDTEWHIDFLNRHYLYLMEDQLDTNRFGRTEALLARHEAMGIKPSLTSYFRGEMLRQRNQPGDELLAVRAYRQSISTGDAPPEAYKNLGYLLLGDEDVAGAKANFRLYLERRPDASDRAMIEFYLED